MIGRQNSAKNVAQALPCLKRSIVDDAKFHPGPCHRAPEGSEVNFSSALNPGRHGQRVRVDHGTPQHSETPWGIARCQARECLTYVLLLALVVGCSPTATEEIHANGSAAPETAAPSAVETGAPDDKTPPASLSGGDWPLFRGDALATGVARSGLPERLEVLWKRSFENGSFEATAAIVDDVVYVGSLAGPFYALDLETGETLWEFSTELGFYATAAVRDGAVYVGDADGAFYCLDAASGELRWAYAANAEIDSSANFFEDKVLFGSQDATLYCLDTASGELVWKYTIDDQIRCSPTVVEDRCFIAGCDGLLHVIDLKTGEEAAAVEIGSQTMCTPAALGDRVYFGTEGETFYCVDWRAAEITWSYQHPKRRFPYRSSAAVTDDLVVVGGRDKMVHGLDPESGESLWEFAGRARFDSSPVIVGERIFIGSSDGRLYALDRKSGEAVWTYEGGGGFVASPAVADGRLVIGNGDGELFCFGAGD